MKIIYISLLFIAFQSCSPKKNEEENKKIEDEKKDQTKKIEEAKKNIEGKGVKTSGLSDKQIMMLSELISDNRDYPIPASDVSNCVYAIRQTGIDISTVDNPAKLFIIFESYRFIQHHSRLNQNEIKKIKTIEEINNIRMKLIDSLMGGPTAASTQTTLAQLKTEIGM